MAKQYVEVLNGIVCSPVQSCPNKHVLQCAPPLQYIEVTIATGTPNPGDSWDGNVFTPKTPIDPAILIGSNILRLKFMMNEFRNKYIDPDMAMWAFQGNTLNLPNSVIVMNWLKALQKAFHKRKKNMVAVPDESVFDFSNGNGPGPLSVTAKDIMVEVLGIDPETAP
jgi:hypothetical protein